jgi:hypothetical protein
MWKLILPQSNHSSWCYFVKVWKASWSAIHLWYLARIECEIENYFFLFCVC